jgi:hypothetical protein
MLYDYVCFGQGSDRGGPERKTSMEARLWAAGGVIQCECRAEQQVRVNHPNQVKT